MEDDPSPSPDRPGRWQLIRNAAVFHLKLLADGLRDLVFAPVSIVLALIDLLTGGDRFNNLMQLGRRTDHWINLFGQHAGEGRGMDEAIGKLEEKLADQYEKGGITASAKRSIDKALDKLSREGADKDASDQT